ncbi:hypothetical protein ACTQZS_13900 [Bilifractor sp. LCP19S3_H10]|uniref:hypothetical protein n=1 Tax=Bilifractor sp. LCP19S3_H10 TaxID=3438736 RepID=UPI003F9306FB
MRKSEAEARWRIASRDRAKCEKIKTEHSTEKQSITQKNQRITQEKQNKYRIKKKRRMPRGTFSFSFLNEGEIVSG